jgi:hypothetical protein
MNGCILFHRTTAEAALKICAEGFKDYTDTYMTGQEWTGVWLADRPLDVNEGAKGPTLLKIKLDVPLDDLDFYEWKKDEKWEYREWLLPASYVNLHMKAEIVEDDYAVDVYSFALRSLVLEDRVEAIRLCEELRDLDEELAGQLFSAINAP